MPLINNLKFYFIFYSSTLNMSIPLSLLAGYIVTTGRTEFGIVSYITDILFMHCTVGTISNILYKEVARKNEYYFYQNAHISKPHIISSAFIIAICWLVIFRLFVNLCNIH